jgi:hypothetical protein
MKLSKDLIALIGSIIFVTIFSVLFHFTYEWSGDSGSVAWFSATDESTFSHMKMLFFPWLLSTVASFAYLNYKGLEETDIVRRRLNGLLIAWGFIVVSFYMYTQDREGGEILGLDIVLFIIAIIGGHLCSYYNEESKVKYAFMFDWGGMLSLFLIIVTSSYVRPDGMWPCSADHSHKFKSDI